MGLDSAWCIVEAWKQTKKIISTSFLRRLLLFGNQIGDKGAMAILEALKTNYTIQQLDTDDNKISESLSAQIDLEMSEKNRKKRRLQLETSTRGEPMEKSS